MIPGEGMPNQKNPLNKGNLYIRFKVELPTLSAQHRVVLQQVLPKRADVGQFKLTPETKQAELQPYQPPAVGEDGEDDEVKEEEEEKKGGVQCAHQ